LTFEDNNTRIRFIPARPFSAGERVTVQLARHLKTPDGTTLPYGFSFQYWVRSLPASLDLQETDRLEVRRPGEFRVTTYGAYAGDLNRDGYTDFVVPNESSNDIRVFMNDGTGKFDGAFAVYPIPEGRIPSTNEGADFNLDGTIDFAVGNTGNNRVAVFRGTGTGHFDDVQTYIAGNGIRGLSVLDLNGDGYKDIVTANEGASTLSLLHNNGDGTFTVLPPILTPGQGERGAEAADINMDGVMDLFVGAIDSEEMIVMLGDGDGGLFFHSRVRVGGQTWMIASGDVNGDGYVDVVSANSLSHNASVMLGNGRGELQQAVTYATGQFPLAIDLGDLDGDGDLDMVTSNFSSGDWTIYENRGDGQFINPRTLQATEAGSCAVLHDRDNDGTLDMTGIDELSDQLFLFTNTTTPTATEPIPNASTFELEPAFPNPFNTQTTLTYTLSTNGPVRLSIYDVLGRRVRTLIDAEQHAGRHAILWNGLDDAGRRVAEGLYLSRLETSTQTRTRQVLYLKH
jgi:hypothetical protein